MYCIRYHRTRFTEDACKKLECRKKHIPENPDPGKMIKDLFLIHANPSFIHAAVCRREECNKERTPEQRTVPQMRIVLFLLPFSRPGFLFPCSGKNPPVQLILSACTIYSPQQTGSPVSSGTGTAFVLLGSNKDVQKFLRF